MTFELLLRFSFNAKNGGKIVFDKCFKKKYLQPTTNNKYGTSRHGLIPLVCTQKFHMVLLLGFYGYMIYNFMGEIKRNVAFHH